MKISTRRSNLQEKRVHPESKSNRHLPLSLPDSNDWLCELAAEYLRMDFFIKSLAWNQTQHFIRRPEVKARGTWLWQLGLERPSSPQAHGPQEAQDWWPHGCPAPPARVPGLAHAGFTEAHGAAGLSPRPTLARGLEGGAAGWDSPSWGCRWATGARHRPCAGGGVGWGHTLVWGSRRAEWATLVRVFWELPAPAASAPPLPSPPHSVLFFLRLQAC